MPICHFPYLVKSLSFGPELWSPSQADAQLRDQVDGLQGSLTEARNRASDAFVACREDPYCPLCPVKKWRPTAHCESKWRRRRQQVILPARPGIPEFCCSLRRECGGASAACVSIPGPRALPEGDGVPSSRSRNCQLRGRRTREPV